MGGIRKGRIWSLRNLGGVSNDPMVPSFGVNLIRTFNRPYAVGGMVPFPVLTFLFLRLANRGIKVDGVRCNGVSA